MITINVNGSPVEVQTEPTTPLVWVLREHLKLTGTKYGCGSGLCGACTVHIDGEPALSCLLPVSVAEGRDVTTIEGIDSDASKALQVAWIDEQVPQCGYCQPGQIMKAAALLERNENPSKEDIVRYMDGNLCRCGTYLRIISAIQRAATESRS
jgi:isoquinoline 1-oxidoreductase alpha subunit